MLENLSKTVKSISEIPVPNERIEVLNPLVDYIQNKVNNQEEIRLNFICTHNSRRSHLSQIWAQTMAFHFGIQNTFCYSGGTEATAMFPKVAETLANQGFEIQNMHVYITQRKKEDILCRMVRKKNYGAMFLLRKFKE